MVRNKIPVSRATKTRLRACSIEKARPDGRRYTLIEEIQCCNIEVYFFSWDRVK